MSTSEFVDCSDEAEAQTSSSSDDGASPILVPSRSRKPSAKVVSAAEVFSGTRKRKAKQKDPKFSKRKAPAKDPKKTPANINMLLMSGAAQASQGEADPGVLLVLTDLFLAM